MGYGTRLNWIVVGLVRDFPLFPLGLVALPSELVPLHIFEERYKSMIARCLEEESEFGIVWLADDGLRPIGCACEVAEVLERCRRRPAEPRRPRDAAVPDRDAPGRARRIRPGVVEFLADREEAPDAEAAAGAYAAYTELVAAGHGQHA